MCRALAVKNDYTWVSRCWNFKAVLPWKRLGTLKKNHFSFISKMPIHTTKSATLHKGWQARKDADTKGGGRHSCGIHISKLLYTPHYEACFIKGILKQCFFWTNIPSHRSRSFWSTHSSAPCKACLIYHTVFKICKFLHQLALTLWILTAFAQAELILSDILNCILKEPKTELCKL